ncbi:MAG: hypothetical protein PHY54_00965 [Methylococcales bacterium]|nr:hypothetical protein [Methylococcales bacterium]
MSSQESQNQDINTVEAGADKKRRRFVAGVSVAAPVILTLASPSVLGQVQCLSQQMSGNASQKPGSCALGLSPGYWMNHTNWPSPYSYGTLKTQRTKTSTTPTITGGTKCLAAFGSAPGPWFTPDSKKEPTNFNLQMSVILLGTDPNQPGANFNGGVIWHLVAALLNAANSSNYVLTVAEVKGLWTGSTKPLPTYISSNANIIAFLETTWQ